MIVWAQGTSAKSKPSRYHCVPDCWINVTGWAKQKPVHPVFETDQGAIEAAGWWRCPYCS